MLCEKFRTESSVSEKPAKMVKLVVATTVDPASICPAKELLAKPGWQPGPTLNEGIRSFSNGDVRLLEHDKGIVEEDDLDQRWENATGQTVDEVIFLSKHTAVSNRPALTIHPIGVPHLKEGDVPPQGGKPGWAAPPNPRMGPWMILLNKIAESHNLIPEFEITFEATHHGPVTTKPTMFIEIGSTEEYWKRPDAAQVVALLVWEGLGLGGGPPVGNWSRGLPSGSSSSHRDCLVLVVVCKLLHRSRDFTLCTLKRVAAAVFTRHKKKKYYRQAHYIPVTCKIM
ncbi:D-aminoacyl-tRNA deacylase-like isoform X3 [Solanum pennellii]|uniref:D-aminoacyl-tRNA deacylase-like isoform X3 n=1 Tax=Solanum pennellii TaxID=28526 RepID=A0ABM1V7Y7_SOLPN|nr:D-aminoacyl-tRNA deacylase-like isoform X3 [Solanum pennellii]